MKNLCEISKSSLTLCFASCLTICIPPYPPTCTQTENRSSFFQLPAWWRRQRPLKTDPRVHVMIVWLAWDFSNWKVDSSSLGYGCWRVKQMKHWEWHLHLSSLYKYNNLIFSTPLGKEKNSFFWLLSTICWARTWKLPPDTKVQVSKLEALRL